jgi:hypothetical protein
VGITSLGTEGGIGKRRMDGEDGWCGFAEEGEADCLVGGKYIVT